MTVNIAYVLLCSFARPSVLLSLTYWLWVIYASGPQQLLQSGGDFWELKAVLKTRMSTGYECALKHPY